MADNPKLLAARGALVPSEYMSDADAHSDIQRAINDINFQIGKLIQQRSALEQAAFAIGSVSV